MDLDSIEFQWPEWEPTRDDGIHWDSPALHKALHDVWNSDTLAQQFYTENPLLNAIAYEMDAATDDLRVAISRQFIGGRDPWTFWNQLAWDHAVDWLQRRAEAAEEWPWPT